MARYISLNALGRSWIKHCIVALGLICLTAHPVWATIKGIEKRGGGGGSGGWEWEWEDDWDWKYEWREREQTPAFKEAMAKFTALRETGKAAYMQSAALNKQSKVDLPPLNRKLSALFSERESLARQALSLEAYERSPLEATKKALLESRDTEALAILAILEAGARLSPRAVDNAQQKYELAKSAAPRDARVPCALALVNMKYQKYDDAMKLLDEVLALDARHWCARHAKIRVHMAKKAYAAALSEIKQLGDLLAAQRDAPGDEAQAALRETPRFLGRVLAYLEGPVAKELAKEKNCKAEQVVAVRTATLDRLSDEERKEFTAGQQEVSDRFEELSRKMMDKAQESKTLREERDRYVANLKATNVALEREYNAARGKALPLLKILRKEYVPPVAVKTDEKVQTKKKVKVPAGK